MHVADLPCEASKIYTHSNNSIVYADWQSKWHIPGNKSKCPLYSNCNSCTVSMSIIADAKFRSAQPLLLVYCHSGAGSIPEGGVQLRQSLAAEPQKWQCLWASDHALSCRCCCCRSSSAASKARCYPRLWANAAHSMTRIVFVP